MKHKKYRVAAKPRQYCCYWNVWDQSK